MNIIQNSKFKKTYKKLHDNQFAEVNSAIEKIIENPQIGDMKKGDLTGIRVYKFQVINQLYLLAYEHNENTLTFHALAPHENFYRDLKN